MAVQIRSVDTNSLRDVVTDSEGRYRAVALAPGSYAVSATLSGL